MSTKGLDDKQKRFIVQALARFDSPTDVAQSVKAEFEIEISRQAIEGYDPTKSNGKRLSKIYKTVFEETRKSYLNDIDSIGIAQSAFRLNKLHEMTMGALSRKNYAQAAQFMEQAAKEVGGAFTNRRDLTNSDGSMRPTAYQFIPYVKPDTDNPKTD